MKKLTKEMLYKIGEGYSSRQLRLGKWDSGAHYTIDLDWDCENYVISADEVMKDLKKNLEKWAKKSKFKIDGRPRIRIEYVR